MCIIGNAKPSTLPLYLHYCILFLPFLPSLLMFPSASLVGDISFIALKTSDQDSNDRIIQKDFERRQDH